MQSEVSDFSSTYANIEYIPEGDGDRKSSRSYARIGGSDGEMTRGAPNDGLTERRADARPEHQT